MGQQVYDAGDIFMMTYVEEEEDDDDEATKEDDKQDEKTDETKPSNLPQLKVVVVKEDGLQCTDPNK